MGRIPISIKKIKVDNPRRTLQSEVSETVAYLFTLEEKGQQWQKTFVCDRNDLLKLRADLDKLIEETTTAELSPTAIVEEVDPPFRSESKVASRIDLAAHPAGRHLVCRPGI